MSMTTDTTMQVVPAYGGGGFGGDGAWWLIVLFLFAFAGWGNNGYGNGGGAAQNYVLSSDFATIQRQLSDGFGGVEKGIDTIRNGLCDGFYTTAQQINGVNTNIMQGNNALQAQLADCCCKTQTAIGEVKYANSINTRDLLENQNANARAIIDKLNAQEMAAKDRQIAEQAQRIGALELAASQVAQNQYLVNQLRPLPIPAYPSCNPWAGAAYGSCSCNCGYNA